MKKLLVLIFSVYSLIGYSQVSFTIQDSVTVNSNCTGTDFSPVIQIPRNVQTNAVFRNNTITYCPPAVYLVMLGDDGPGPNDNNLDGAIVSGNKLVHTGYDLFPGGVMHGLMAGYQVNQVYKWNYFVDVCYPVVYKTGGEDDHEGMTNTSGGFSYNIVQNGKRLGIKGTSGVRVYNNTFYSNRNSLQDYPFIKITSNNDDPANTPLPPSKGTKIKNNIFYSTHRKKFFQIEFSETSFENFECDYNIYYVEDDGMGGHEPLFQIDGGVWIDFDAWKALGFDTHSIIMDPSFIDREFLVPSNRLDYGTNQGSEFEEGLAVHAVWGAGNPATTMQNGIWQVGAHIYSSSSILVESINVAGEEGVSVIAVDNGTLQLNISLLPNNATYQTVSWSLVNGTGEATISSSGLVTAVSNGTVTARATANDGSGVFGELIITISNSLIPVTGISVTSAGGSSLITTDNGTLQLNATITPADASNQTVTWSLVNGTGEATISSSGLVTAVSNGTVTARATANDGSGVFGELIITISNQIIPVTGISVTSAGGSSLITTDNGTLQLNATITPADASNQTVTWSLVNGTGEATISSSGLVTAVSNGTVTARATANDGSGVFGELIITISNSLIPVTGISVTSAGGSSLITTDNGTLQLNATITPADASNQTVTWSLVNGTGEATISSSGLVTAVSNGTVTARATANDGSGVFGELIITISNSLIPVTGISVTSAGGSSLITTDNGTLQLNATITPADASNQTVTWSLVNGTGEATISSSGLVTAVSNGTVTARATANDGSGVFGELIITISNQIIPVTGISVTSAGGSSLITTDNGTLQLNATITPADASNQTVTWSLVNGTGEATISSSGLVTAVSNGTVTARATANDGSGVFGELIITISNSLIPVTGISVTSAGGSSLITTDNGTLQLNATITPADASNQTVTWSLVNGTGEATISSSGLVTAVSNGTVTARATANDGSGVFGELIITISNQIIPVTGISVTSAGGSSLITTDNGTLQLNATITPADASNQTVTWSLVNGTGEATISSSGLVTAVSNGTVTARATANDGSGVFGELIITISNSLIPVTGISVTSAGGSSLITTDNGTLQLNATITPADASNQTVTWSLVNGTGEATISSSGLVTAVSNGTVTARATANDGSGVTSVFGITINLNESPDFKVIIYLDYLEVRFVDNHTGEQLSLHNLKGQIVNNKIINGNECKFETASLPQGIYIIVLSESRIYQTKKIFIPKYYNNN